VIVLRTFPYVRLRAKRIVEHVGADVIKVGARIDQFRAKASLEERSDAPTWSRVVEVASIGRLQAMEELGEETAWVLDDEMEVVRHQAEAVTDDASKKASVSEKREED